MQKYKKPNIIEKDLGMNPFKQELEVPVNKIYFENSYKFEDGLLIPVTKDVEQTPYAKLYSTSTMRLHINKLSLRAKELLFWIIYTIEFSNDFIWINKVRYMKELNISSLTTYKEAIKELMKNGIIAVTIQKDVYWINPVVFFKGDRIKKYPEKVIIVNDNSEI